jgi:hypothetical protein
MAGLGLGDLGFYDLDEILVYVVAALHVHNASLGVEQHLDELLRSRFGGFKDLL